MWKSSISPSNLSLIGQLTSEIYYRTGITGKTDKHTETESDSLPKQDRVTKTAIAQPEPSKQVTD